MKIQAAVTPAQGEDFTIEKVTLAPPRLNEVLVRVVATGVCHTDAVARDLGISPYPIVLGHEGSGIVEEIGENVTSLEVGDHVVMSFAHCGQCENCLTGHPTVCSRFNELNFGGRMEDGTCRLHQGDTELSTFFGQSSFGTHVVAHERNVVKVDKDVDLALLGPLGCGIQTGAGTVLNRLKPAFGTSIAVYGCGAVGLSAIMAAKIAGCQQIFAIDVHESRLQLAGELGATHVLNGKEVDVVKEIKEASMGGTHYAVESTGVPPVVRQCLHALRPLGQAAIVGVTPEMNIDVHNDLMAEGKSMIGVIEGDSVPRVFIPKLVEFFKAGKFPFDKLVKFYRFDQINQAFEDSANGIAVKPVLRLA
ncbi:NAD(P)-dependent alcohol dehydrogenase [Aromatoleum aromaticum]|uniref:NAD(P)-dependent alcohol dehydrogenase n=1 Tax=Aromatoleum aromaticum TaxID=551760 RepID=UPI0014594EDE|nr:NAD(P)-dependent alcohol dehydrogenase [Aromatoleum aromaticum]NMG53807.1 zinc-binding dehydrogenase [Aromatoleum aromaticum]